MLIFELFSMLKVSVFQDDALLVVRNPQPKKKKKKKRKKKRGGPLEVTGDKLTTITMCILFGL